MDNAGPMIDMAKAELIRAYRPETSTVSFDDITTFCDNLDQFSVLWDDSFAAINTSDPSENDLTDTQIKINKAMAKIR